jgi:hypothetical protein
VAELVLRGVCASRPLLENRDRADARGGLQHRRDLVLTHPGARVGTARHRHRNTQRNANLEFAGKSGDEIRNQLVLWLIEKGVLIPGPNDVIPEGAKNILVNRGFGLRS